MFPAVDFRRTLINDFHKVLIFPAKAEQKFWQKYSWYQKLPRSPSSLSSDKFDRIRVHIVHIVIIAIITTIISLTKLKSQSVLKWKIN